MTRLRLGIYWTILTLLSGFCSFAADQPTDTNTLWFIENYTKYEHLVPMRDGVRLFTRVYVPKDNSQEWPILLTARTLDRIDTICGEYHLGRYPELFHVGGCEDFTPALLDDFLSDQGFRVRIQPSPREPEKLGLFFATR